MTKTEKALYEVSRGSVRGFIEQALENAPKSIPYGTAKEWLELVEDRYVSSLRKDFAQEEPKVAPTRRSRKEK